MFFVEKQFTMIIPSRAALALACVGVGLVSAPASADSFFWDNGGGTDINVGNPTNWFSNAAPPASGFTADVTFTNEFFDIINQRTTPDFQTNVQWATLNFNGNSNFNLVTTASRGINLTRGITVNGSASHQIALPTFMFANNNFIFGASGGLSFAGAGNARVVNQGFNLNVSNAAGNGGAFAINMPMEGAGGLNVALKAAVVNNRTVLPTLTLSGNNTFTGGTTLSGGRVVLTNGSLMGNVNVTVVTNEGGELIVESGGRIGPVSGAGTGTLHVNSLINSARSPANATLASGGVINVATTRLGDGSSTFTTLGQSGGTFTQTGGTHTTGLLAIDVLSTGAYYLLSGGTLTAGSESLNRSADFRQSGGTHVVTNTMTINARAIDALPNAVYRISGGALSAGAIVVGDDRIGDFRQSGGAVTAAGFVSVGTSVGDVNADEFSSGTYYLNGTNSTLKTPSLLVGSRGTGKFILGGGTATVATDDLSAGGVVLGSALGGTGTLDLFDGTLATRAVVGGAGQSFLNFRGGTLKALVDSDAFITGIDSLGLAGNAIIDTNGRQVTIGQTFDPFTSGGVIKRGAGTLRLTGNYPVGSPYTGETIVEAGTLLINNTTGTGTGQRLVTVRSGATLGGTGFIAGGKNSNTGFEGSDALIQNGGRLAPGDGGTGTLTFGVNSDVTAELGSTLAFELGGNLPNQSDLIRMNGLLTLAGNLDITRLSSFDLTIGNSLTVLTNSSAMLTLGTFANAPAGFYTDLDDGRIYRVNYVANIDGTANDITLTRVSAVPEPAILSLLGLTSLATLRRARVTGGGSARLTASSYR